MLRLPAFPASALVFFLPLAAQEDPATARDVQMTPPSAPGQARSPVLQPDQWLTGSIAFGYRFWSGVGGDKATYRTVVNLGAGPKLFGINGLIRDPSRRVFDRVYLFANHLGGEPYSTFQVDAERTKTYRFLVDYRSIAYYSALPSYADPLFAGGIVLDERSNDTRIKFLNTLVELRPGTRIVPYFGYWRNGDNGTGVTTYVTTGNEYPLPMQTETQMNDYRGGVRFQFRNYQITVEQGGASFDFNQRVFTTPTSAPTTGNVSVPILGRNLGLSTLNEVYNVTGTSIYTRGLLTARPADWISLYGQFLYNSAARDTAYSAAAQGLFLSFTPLQSFTGLQSQVSSTVKQPQPSGLVGFELRPAKRLRFIESFMTNRFHNAASTLITDQVLVPGQAGNPVTTPLDDHLVYTYNRQELNGFFDITPKLVLRGGFRIVWGNASQTALPGGARTFGTLQRYVGIAGLNYRPNQRVRTNLLFEMSNGVRNYFRSSLQDYVLVAGRASYQVRPSLLLWLNMNLLNNRNPAPTIDWDYTSWWASAGFQWNPGQAKRFSILGEYGHSEIRLNTTYIVPSTFERVPFIYRSIANTASGWADIRLPKVQGRIAQLAFGGSLFMSSGSWPTRYYQPMVRLTIPARNRVQVYAEWWYYGMTQIFFPVQGFRSNLVSLGLRVSKE